jgi:hypothetical protein
MLAARVSALVLALIASAACRPSLSGSYDYTIRIGAGATRTTEGEVGGRIEITLGLNAHASGRHYVAMTGRAGANKAGGREIDGVGALSAEWVMRHRHVMHRLGAGYTAVRSFDGDSRSKAGGLRGGLLFSIFSGPGSALEIGGDDPPGIGSGGSLGIDADSTRRSGDAQGRGSLGVELGGDVIVTGDTSAGRGLGYAGLVFQYDILRNPGSN